MTDPAADDQRNTLFSRDFTGSINRGDHRVTRQNHQINGLVVLIVVLSKPRPNGIHGVEGCASRQGKSAIVIVTSLQHTEPSIIPLSARHAMA